MIYRPDLEKFKYAFLGSPYVECAASNAIDLNKLSYAYLGAPFVAAGSSEGGVIGFIQPRLTDVVTSDLEMNLTVSGLVNSVTGGISLEMEGESEGVAGGSSLGLGLGLGSFPGFRR